jgi:hypothetical protein
MSKQSHLIKGERTHLFENLSKLRHYRLHVHFTSGPNIGQLLILDDRDTVLAQVFSTKDQMSSHSVVFSRTGSIDIKSNLENMLVHAASVELMDGKIPIFDVLDRLELSECAYKDF